MSSALLDRGAEPRGAATAPPDRAVRAFLAGYARTLLPLVVGSAALPTGWTLTGAGGRPAALVGVGLWVAGSAALLHRRAWSPATVSLVTWAVPAALLAPSAALGLVSADGLVLWAPVATVLAVCLVLTHRPLPAGGGRHPTG